MIANNNIISECSKYPICYDLWERDDNGGRTIPSFSCKECVGYECYWRGYTDGRKESKE